jgi:hypothetical protein
MIRLEFFRYYAPQKGWVDTGKSYDNIAAAKYAANMGRTNFRIVQDGKVIWYQDEPKEATQ